MSLDTREDPHGKILTITINGRFDFSVQRDFRNAFIEHRDANWTYKVDLSQTEYIDSSALGMLLILKEHAEGTGSKVVLFRPSEAIDKVLKMANFGHLFTIDQ